MILVVDGHLYRSVVCTLVETDPIFFRSILNGVTGVFYFFIFVVHRTQITQTVSQISHIVCGLSTNVCRREGFAPQPS